MKVIGVLAIQGDVEKHAGMLKKAGAIPLPVKTERQLEGIEGLVIPGGESTTIGKLMVRFALMETIRKKIISGLPVLGTCAGAILLAKNIQEYDQPHIGVMDITISRNAYGSQIESFETDICVPSCGNKSIHAVFIRAPIITKVGKDVIVLSRFESKPVLVQEKNMIAATFHPELTDDMRIHEYFLKMLRK